MPEIENGCIGLGERVTDYKLTEGLLDALPNLYLQDEIIYQYNQGTQRWSEKSCTLFSPIGAVSDLFNVEIPLDIIKVRDNDSYGKGRPKDSGWLVSMGVDHIVKEWNDSDFAKKYGKVAYYSIDLKDDELVKKVLDKRYTICTGYQGNNKYNNDKRDGLLENTEFGTSTYGHAVNAIRGINTPSRIKDNYYKSVTYNIYGVKHEFSEIPCFYTRGYVLTKVAEDSLEEVKRLNKMRTLTENMIADNSAMRHLTNDENYKAKLHDMNEAHRRKLSDIQEQLNKYL